jgi:bifunctional DNA-binding transcriptional regulator/antitoxin component of YhaV-PrlF toxin-antitoxin module
MATLTVTADRRVTLRKEVLAHLGIRPGDKLELELLPEGRGLLRAAKAKGTMSAFIGLLAGKSSKTARLDEINEAAARGWVGDQS